MARPERRIVSSSPEYVFFRLGVHIVILRERDVAIRLSFSRVFCRSIIQHHSYRIPNIGAMFTSRCYCMLPTSTTPRYEGSKYVVTFLVHSA